MVNGTNTVQHEESNRVDLGDKDRDRWRTWLDVPGWSAWTPQWPERCLGGGPESLRAGPPHEPSHGSQSDKDSTD